jgi:O-methyltransferase involved in polyketide biosynthesis
MSRERIRLHREQETMLMTLYLHAHDARSDHPILGDSYAAPLLERIDYDFAQLDKLKGNQPLIVSRAKAIDDLVRDFLAVHPEPVVVHLGCGLDSRVQRIDPGPSIAWFDLDQEPVIDLRRRLFPDRDGVTTLAASATDPAVWVDLPPGRPTLVVGEGLLMYLTPEGVGALIDAALARTDVPAQTLIFDTVAPWVRRVSRLQPNFRHADTGFLSTTNDLDAAMRRHSGVNLVDERSVVTLARQASIGILSAIDGVVDALGPGHRAMVLRTYETHVTG